MTNTLRSLAFLLIIPTLTISDRDTLALHSKRWFIGVLVWGGVVALGCLLEVFETRDSFHQWKNVLRNIRLEPEDQRSWHKPAAALGLLLVIVGIVGETVCEGFVSFDETSIRQYDEDALGAAKQVAAFAQRDAACARKETAQLDNETQGLKTDAAAAKRDMVNAQLELARLTGPAVKLSVVGGMVRPDPMKGVNQKILLHSNVIFVFPRLQKGKSLNWTLSITQDEVGNRQFGTIPKFMPGGDAKSPYGNPLELTPRSECTMSLSSDEHGTRDNTFGGASCPTTPIPK